MKKYTLLTIPTNINRIITASKYNYILGKSQD